MKLGILAGKRFLPIFFVQKAKEKNPGLEIVAVCFKGETSPRIKKFVEKDYWINVGELTNLLDIVRKEKINSWVMVGQITPTKVFRRHLWDNQMHRFVAEITDFRPHSVFVKLIERLEREGVKFISSIEYIQDQLSSAGVMNKVEVSKEVKNDIDFGLRIIETYRDLDVGQTVVVKDKVVVALEGLEGTDYTLFRAYRLAGRGVVVLKFSKTNQDLRFDVPIVGIKTLKILRKIRAKALVLEAGRVVILEKEKFLYLAERWNIPVIGVVAREE